MKKIIVVDVETANANISSICQIGIAVFSNGKLIETWESLVNPECEFDEFNVYIHGINAKKVTSSPTIQDLKEKINSYFNENLVCSYSYFDKNAFSKHLNLNEVEWLDIMRVVRRVWDEFSKSGYGLSNVCKKKNIELLNHHNALNDAISAGSVLLQAMKEKSLDIEDLKKFSSHSKNYEKISLHGNEQGQWFGEILAFTGELSIPRKKAAEIAAIAGFEVTAGVTKKTTFLVKGYQDNIRIKGKEFSSKEKKALALIEKGQDIKIISEDDFTNIIN